MPPRMSRATSRSPPVALRARCLAREIRLHAAQPLLGRGFAVVRDHRGDERRVVRMLAGTDADLALPFRIGERLVRDRVELHVLVDVQHAVAQRQRVPVTARAAQVRGNRAVERRRARGLREPAVDEIEQIADVDRHQHVGGRARAFGLHALEQAVLDEHRVDGDAALLRERVDERLDQLRLAGRVQVDFVGRVRGGRDGGERECERERAQQRAQQRAGLLDEHRGLRRKTCEEGRSRERADGGRGVNITNRKLGIVMRNGNDSHMRIARKKTDESRRAQRTAVRMRLRVECRLDEFLMERDRR